MALIDPAVFQPARFAKTLSAPDARNDIPRAALARLAALHGEAIHNMALFQFLARAPQACLCLMLAGATVLVWTSLNDSNATLKSEFLWVFSVLLGVVAITASYIRNYARGARQMRLQAAAARLRLLLLYTGAAWGAGAFLVMPELPSPVLVLAFAVLPNLVLTGMLQDRKGAAAFIAPVTLTTASAAMIGNWPAAPWVAGAVLASGLLAFRLPMLHRETASRDLLPTPR